MDMRLRELLDGMKEAGYGIDFHCECAAAETHVIVTATTTNNGHDIGIEFKVFVGSDEIRDYTMTIDGKRKSVSWITDARAAFADARASIHSTRRKRTTMTYRFVERLRSCGMAVSSRSTKPDYEDITVTSRSGHVVEFTVTGEGDQIDLATHRMVTIDGRGRYYGRVTEFVADVGSKLGVDTSCET